MELADVLRAGAPADALSSTSLPVIESSKTYKDYNHLKNFVLTFPPSSQPSLKRPVSSVSCRAGLFFAVGVFPFAWWGFPF